MKPVAVIIFLFSFQLSNAQPANDSCEIATQLIESIDGSCNNVAIGTTVGATMTSEIFVRGELPAEPFPFPAVWYQFTPDSTSNYVLDVTNDSGLFDFWFIATGQCNDTLVLLDKPGLDPSGHLLTKDSLYYIFGTTIDGEAAFSATSFEICLISRTLLPATNLTCAVADTIIESGDNTCANLVFGHTLNANTIDTLSCIYYSNLSFNRPAVWYSYTAVSDTVLIDVNSSGFGVFTNVAVYSNSCDSLVMEVCGRSPFGFVAIPDSTYLISVTPQAIDTFGATFDICIHPCDSVPANYLCANSIPLTESSSGSCDNQISGTTTCSIIDNNDYLSTLGVWYSFQPDSTTIYTFDVNHPVDNIIGFINIFANSCGPYPTCGRFAPMEIALIKDSVYYLSVNIFNILEGKQGGDFNICVYETPTCLPAPTNDSCINAIELMVGLDMCSAMLTGDLTCSTSSSLCANGDIWFSATVPDSGALMIETSEIATPNLDLFMTAYSGTCASLTQVGSDDDGGTGLYALLDLAGLTAGDTILINISDLGNLPGTFSICAWDPNPGSCPDNLVLSDTVTVSTAYEASVSILSTQHISNPAQVTYKAGSAINLNQNFEVEGGALFEALIDNCAAAALNENNILKAANSKHISSTMVKDIWPFKALELQNKQRQRMIN